MIVDKDAIGKRAEAIVRQRDNPESPYWLTLEVVDFAVFEVERALGENEKLLKVEEAARGLLPYIHEDGMEGETTYELAVLELERVLAEVKR